MPREIWVATTTFHGSATCTVEGNTEAARILLEAACAQSPDIVCRPETFASTGVQYTDAKQIAQPVPGPLTDMVAEAARRHSTYVICPLLEERDGRVYNSAALIDRHGQIAGLCEKIHSVTSRSDYTLLEHGVMPGSEAKVIQTDFGLMGILICYDIHWPREWAELKRKGAGIVFWHSAYSGGFLLQVYAFLHHYFVVSSTHTDARLIDLTGEIMGRAGRATPVANAQIDLAQGVFHGDFNWTQIGSLRVRYGRDVMVRVLHDEALMTIESQREGLTLSRIIEEMGLETLSDCVARNERAQDALREHRSLTPQPPPYLGRQQYLA